MYTSYFGLKENPFNLTPDPRYLYLSHHHKEAFDHLLYGINERKGFIVITGGIGTGKTTLLRALLAQLNSSTKSALIFNPSISDEELLVTINQEFGIDADGKGKSQKEHLDILNRFLLETFSHGKNAVLLIDEAQNLSHTVLEQIRMLSNLETEKEKLLQIVLVGQPELKELLSAPALKQLKERITVWYDLLPLDRDDVRTYIEHRLVIAGAKRDLKFVRGAFKTIYAYSKGNPRRINAVCDRALLITYSKDEFTVTKNTVIKAINDIQGNIFERGSSKGQPWRYVLIMASLALLAVLVLGGWYFKRDILSLSLTTDTENAVLSHDPPVSSSPPFIEIIEEPEPVLPEPLSPLQEKASVLLDEETSLALLFKLFHEEEGRKDNIADNAHLVIFSFKIEPECYIMFRKPFQMCINNDVAPEETYLLIKEVVADGAVVINSAGKESNVSKDFILAHCEGTVSWFFPYHWNRETNGSDVLRFQQILQTNGYPVEATGLYDNPTVDMVRRFQNDFGLKPDGIIGVRTRGLLYQMSQKSEDRGQRSEVRE
jgi:general secretion pathway protein A